MPVTGIIAEYNPFHNGHSYHLAQAQHLTAADYVICILSANFTQRGEPAVVNKWARTRMALAEGVDIVIELPVVYAAQHAQGFADGAVKLLAATGVVDYLVFGSEHGKVAELEALAHFLWQEVEPFRKILKKYLRTGIPFPAARASSLMDYQREKGIPGLEQLSPDQVYSLIRHPNNILALEYLQTLTRLKSTIRPLTIRRLGAGYHEQELQSGVASATAIRLALQNKNRYSQLSQVIPPKAWQILGQEMEAGRAPVFLEAFSSQIISLLRRAPLPGLRQIAGVNEGLENRLKRAACSSSTIKTLLEALKTKRYTQTRLQRLLLHSLLNLNKKDAASFSPGTNPCYLRLLGFSPRGARLLRSIKKRASLPLITKPGRDFPLLARTSQRTARMWELECLATDLYVLAYPNPQARKAGQDYTEPLVIIDDTL